MGSFVTGLFCCRISKGLSEKVFAKCEQQEAAEEVVEDTGKGELVKPPSRRVHLRNCGDGTSQTWRLCCGPHRCFSLLAGDPVPYTFCRIAWIIHFSFCTFLGINSGSFL